MENEKQFETTENGERIFKVPESNVETLRGRIEKLNKRAVKLGCAAIVISVLKEYDVPAKQEMNCVTGKFETVSYRRYFDLTVTGSTPKINGWELLAVIEPICDEDGKVLGNMLRKVPGSTTEVPLEYRDATSKCDHCKTDRRRNETFVLKHESGETKQVGRQCLRDFLGHANPEMLASIAEMLFDAEAFAEDSEHDDFEGGCRHIDRFVAEEVLALAACSIRLNGWRSNKTANEYGSLSTSGEVSNWIFTTKKSDWEKPLIPTDEDKATAKEVVEWLAKLSERPELNDYMYNLAIAGKGAMLTTKNFGLVCSAIPTYLREMEREINRRKQFESEKNSQFVGEVGKREKFTLTLVLSRDFESQFGVTHFYKFRDEVGNVVVWFSSNVFFNDAAGRDIDAGDTVVIEGRVEEHTYYQDKNDEEKPAIAQTRLTRCKTWESPEAKKAAAKIRKAEREAEKKEQEKNNANLSAA